MTERSGESRGRRAPCRCRDSHEWVWRALDRAGYVLALYESGKVEGWGANNSGEIGPPSLKFQAVAAGKAYSLGLDEDGFLH